MARKNGSLYFPDAVAAGENPRGFVAQTPAGTRKISNDKLRIWEEGPDYPPIKTDGTEWGRRPLYKPDHTHEDTRKK
jgi:hypothetical protein